MDALRCFKFGWLWMVLPGFLWMVLLSSGGELCRWRGSWAATQPLFAAMRWMGVVSGVMDRQHTVITSKQQERWISW